MFTGFYLTNKGANLLAKSQAGVVINFTKVGIGKGDLPPGTSITSVTALFNKVKDLPIAGVSANNGQAQIGFQFVNTGITAFFLWKELGLYATDPDEGEILYAYGYTTEPDPIPSESQLVEFLFNMIVKISNTTQITATIDQSLIYATNAVATETSNGLMTKEDKTKLDGIEENANNYTHPTGDGNLHVPATGTTNNGKVLKAGATAGSAAWGNLTAADVGAYSKSEVDVKESALNSAIGQNAQYRRLFLNNDNLNDFIALESYGTYVLLNSIIVLNAPLQNVNALIEIIPSIGAVKQIFTVTDENMNKGRSWSRLYNANGFSTWKEIATTEKTSFLATANTGYTIVRQNNYKINNIVYINMVVKKSNNNDFVQGIQQNLANFGILNVTFSKNIEFIPCFSNQSGITGAGGVGVLFTDKNVYVHPTQNCAEINISGCFLEEV